jgi:hypothetical protein
MSSSERRHVKHFRDPPSTMLRSTVREDFEEVLRVDAWQSEGRGHPTPAARRVVGHCYPEVNGNLNALN